MYFVNKFVRPFWYCGKGFCDSFRLFHWKKMLIFKFKYKYSALTIGESSISNCNKGVLYC